MIAVLETTTGATWELVGYPNYVSHIAIFPEERLLVGMSRTEVRTWHLDTPPVTRVPGFSCMWGNANVWDRESGKITQVHHHATQAFGVHWLRDKMCSASWDGTIRCSLPDGTANEVFTLGGGRLMAFIAAAKHDFLLMAVADGRIWRLDDQLHELYSQQAVPWSLALDATDSAIVSSGHDGSIVVFDLNTKQVISRTIPYEAAAWRVASRGDTFLTAGADGWLRRWRRSGNGLVLRDEHRAAGPYRLIIAIPDGWAGAIDDGTLLITMGSHPPWQLDFGRHIYSIDVSSDQRYLAANLRGEIAVIDLQEHRLATLPMDTMDSAPVKFLDARSLAVGVVANMAIVRIAELDYVPF